MKHINVECPHCGKTLRIPLGVKMVDCDNCNHKLQINYVVKDGCKDSTTPVNSESEGEIHSVMEEEDNSEQYQSHSHSTDANYTLQKYRSEPLDKAGCFGCFFVFVTVIGSFALGFSVGEGFKDSLLTGAALAFADILVMTFIYGVYSSIDDFSNKFRKF